MEKALITDKKLSFDKLYDFERIYIGNDICPKMLDFNNIEKCVLYYLQNKKISLLLPFLKDDYLKKTALLLNKIISYTDDDFEIIFNDWGTFYFLNNNYPDIKLVLGRLLTKQKKDSRINIILDGLQDKFKILKSDKGNKIIYTKKVPKSLKNIFYGHSVATKLYFDFLLAHNVSRIEIDNIKGGIISCLPGTIKTDLYYPYTLLTLTGYCGAMHGEYNKTCNKNCLGTYKYIGDNYYIKGNAIFYENNMLPAGKVLIKNNIDRLVVQNI